jgi:arginyl-tRNA synthetase
MKQELAQTIQSACKELFDVEVRVVLTRPDEQFGDYATNVALQLAKQLGKNPREVAQAIASHVEGSASGVDAIEVAGPGFLNVQAQ